MKRWALVVLSLFTGWRSASVSGYCGPVSDHFNGERFTNGTVVQTHSIWAVLRWRFFNRRDPRLRWPAWVSSDTSAAPIPTAPADALRITFVNHATWLIQIGGLNVLTDPIWSTGAGPTDWLGPRRVRAAGVRFEDLPRIDAVLISHNHYDHLDVPTLQRLETRDHPLFVVGLGNAGFLKKYGFARVQELDWWQSLRLGDTEIVFVPARHWSRRGFNDINKTLWGGYVVRTTKDSLYFSGDTGYGDHFKTIGQRFPHLDVALLPIGAYEPRWFMKASHMNPAEAVQAYLDLGARQAYGMHFGTFQLSNERIDQPARDLVAARQAHHLSEISFVVPEFGRTYRNFDMENTRPTTAD